MGHHDERVASKVAAPLPEDAAPSDDCYFLLRRNLGLLRDDAANGFEALFIVSRRLGQCPSSLIIG